METTNTTPGNTQEISQNVTDAPGKFL